MKELLHFYIVIIFFLVLSCRNSEQSNEKVSAVLLEEVTETTAVALSQDTLFSPPTLKVESIYGDTVWVYPYGVQEWRDTIVSDNYSVFMSVGVDTTDFLVDTVKSKKGNRIVIGYNHYYKLEFRKEGKKWFTSEFNKRQELANLLGESEYWLESNLNVFQKIIYNQKFEKFVVEFDINPRYNYGSVYYLIINDTGGIEYMGISNTWGGGGPDGDSFLSLDMSSFISCYEIYNFEYNIALSIAEYVMLAENRSSGKTATLYKQVHALRKLKGDNFLVIFNLFRGKPEFNGLILNMDTTILQRFRYYGLMEEMDAMVLFIEEPIVDTYFLYDTEREVLICLSENDTLLIDEFLIAEMVSLPVDSFSQKQTTELDFEAFGSYRFYIDSSRAKIYRGAEGIE